MSNNAIILKGHDNIRKSLSDLKQISSFIEDGLLRKNTTGVISNKCINTDVFFAFGKDIFKYKLKRSDKAKTLPSKTSVELSFRGDATIDSFLLPGVLMAPRNSNHKGLHP